MLESLAGGAGATAVSEGIRNTPQENRRRMMEQSMKAQQKMAQSNADYQRLQHQIMAMHRSEVRRRMTEGIVLKPRQIHAPMMLVPPAKRKAQPDTSWEKQIFKLIDEIINLHTIAHGKPESMILGQFEIERFRRFFEGPHMHNVECHAPQSLPQHLEQEYLQETFKPPEEQNMEKFSEYRFSDGIETDVYEVMYGNTPVATHRVITPKAIKGKMPYFSFKKLAVVESREPFMIDVSCRNWFREMQRQRGL